ncbi:MAG TPA: hypothetical protein VG778_10710 [Blastocatellia bacterium]|jgi:hypothetical protein|nr:hypothetical protein [Blastocatellia bacterium]
MEGRTTSRNKARLLVVAVFVIGVAAGALSMNLYQRASGSDRPTRRGGDPRPDIVQKMTDRLNLTGDQRTQIDAIVKETFGKYDELRKLTDPCFNEVKPRFDAVRQEGRGKMRAVLTEKQLPEFEKMVIEQDARRENSNRDHKK